MKHFSRLILVIILIVSTVVVIAQDEDVTSVAPILETAPSPGDGATGVRIWVHPTNPAFSLLLTGDDNEGLGVFNLSGELVQFLEVGGVKHADVRYNFPLGDQRISLVAAGVEDTYSVLLFTVNEESLQLEPIGEIETGILQNGLCMYRSPLTNSYYVIALSDDGSGEQWLIDGSSGTLEYSLRRAFSIGSETENCVADDEFRFLYIAEEAVAIWRYGAEPESGTVRRIVDVTGERGNIEEEAEALALYTMPDGNGYLIVADQTGDRYNLYERRGGNAFIGAFGFLATDTLDAVGDAVGIDVVPLPLNDNFPEGLFVTQDDTNSQPNEDNNFKLASWGDIADAMGLAFDTSFDPRTVGAEAVTGIPVVTTALETEPVQAGVDAADDPAIWLHPTDANLSLIIGTDKTTGLVTYNLDGTIQQSLPIGRVNNVDLRYNFDMDGVPTDVVATTNRTTNSLDLFAIDPETRLLENIAQRTIVSGVEEVYGVCFYVSPVSGDYYVFVNSAATGEVEQYRLYAINGQINALVVREFVVGSQTEGCAADDELGVVYIGEEAVGFYKYQAEPDADDSRVQIDSTGLDGNLTADVEGIAIYYGEGDAGYLLVSSQGSSEFAVYERSGDNAYLGSFVAIEGGAADGVSGTDGIDVMSAPFGDLFPNGVFIAQDDLNIDPNNNQNFKLIDWAEIAASLDLEIYNGYDPRAR